MWHVSFPQPHISNCALNRSPLYTLVFRSSQNARSTKRVSLWSVCGRKAARRFRGGREGTRGRPLESVIETGSAWLSYTSRGICPSAKTSCLFYAMGSLHKRGIGIVQDSRQVQSKISILMLYLWNFVQLWFRVFCHGLCYIIAA